MKYLTALQHDINRVRALLGSAESLVPDHAIVAALNRFSVSAAVHYIRLSLAGPRMEHAERKITAES